MVNIYFYRQKNRGARETGMFHPFAKGGGGFLTGDVNDVRFFDLGKRGALWNTGEGCGNTGVWK